MQYRCQPTVATFSGSYPGLCKLHYFFGAAKSVPDKPNKKPEIHSDFLESDTDPAYLVTAISVRA
jgi:hypothetical protein